MNNWAVRLWNLGKTKYPDCPASASLELFALEVEGTVATYNR